MTPMKPAAAKVSGNQGRMAGRRLAVGFLQIVPGEFPAGVVTDQLPRFPLFHSPPVVFTTKTDILTALFAGRSAVWLARVVWDH